MQILRKKNKTVKKKKKEPKKVEVKKEDKKEEKKSTRVKIDGRKIGRSIISSIGDVTLNGTDYKRVETIDGLTYTLSQEDFNNQVSE